MNRFQLRLSYWKQKERFDLVVPLRRLVPACMDVVLVFVRRTRDLPTVLQSSVDCSSAHGRAYFVNRPG